MSASTYQPLHQAKTNSATALAATNSVPAPVLQDQRDARRLKGVNAVQLRDLRGTASGSSTTTIGTQKLDTTATPGAALGDASMSSPSYQSAVYSPSDISTPTPSATYQRQANTQAVMQLKSLDQAGKAGGLVAGAKVDLNSTQDGPSKGMRYSKAAADAADKPSALKEAAKVAGDQGQQVQALTYVSKQNTADEVKTVVNAKKAAVAKALNDDLHGKDVALISKQELLTAVTSAQVDQALADKGVPNAILDLDYAQIYEATYTAPHHLARVQVGKNGAKTRAGYEAHITAKTFPQVRGNALEGQANLKFLDPFSLRVNANYGNANGKLALDYQFAHDWPGYIVNIKHENGVGGAIDSSMAIRGHLDAGAGNGIPNTFSNVHDTANGATLATLLDTDANATQASNEVGIDAHARIAGEGARWVAVREHAASIKNSTRFYAVKDGQAALAMDDRVVRYIDFHSLWLSWETKFDKKYNISNATFSSELKDSVMGDNAWKGQGLKEDKHVSDMTADDFKVD